jgi:hypothetical protein
MAAEITNLNKFRKIHKREQKSVRVRKTVLNLAKQNGKGS